MRRSFIFSAVAAASLCASFGALGQASGLDVNVNPNANDPQVRQQPQPAAPAPPRANDRRDRDQRDAQQGQRREADRGQGERRDRERDRDRDRDRPGYQRRDYYVAPRPYFRPPPPVYYSAPPVYYGPPPVYYGGAPQTYYPGYAPAQLFQPGDYLPPEFRSPQFVVTDWYWRGLSEPPFGYQWMVLGPDNFALVAVATGQIASIVVTR